MNNQSNGLGAIISTPDYRDGIAAAGIYYNPVTLPPSFDTILASPMNQHMIPACVSHSVVEALKLYWFRKAGKWINFSPRFLDILAKRFDGQDRTTGGTFPRLVFKLAVKYGCATTATLPNDTTLPTLVYRQDSALSDAVMAEAKQYAPSGYIRVPLDFNSLRRHIYFYGAISTLFSIGDTLWLPSWAPQDTDPLRIPTTVVSGHQMTVKGWTTPQLNKLRNEWGATWAINGETEYDPQAWSPFVNEAWCFAEVPQNIKDFLLALPAPGDFHYVWNADMHQGEFSEDIKMAQIALMILGYLTPVKPEELGHYGPKTAAAVMAYQGANGIYPPAAGSIGPKTRAALNFDFMV